METYGKILLIAMPAFLLLVLFEKWYGWRRHRETVRTLDMISSLSSGVTNVTKDVLALTIQILTYGWLVKHIALYHIQNTWVTYVVAFLAIDFAGYWMHRWSHHMNLLWNLHVIHHSSEDFNLACALRQSISLFINPFAFLLLPAALLGVPLQVIATVGPLQLFAQFWYHTQHIKRMGFLEYIIVTPSHHRVHHAVNKEYLDKNLSQIFIIWDRLFGTFQEELKEVPPVYGITRPAQTWNPIRINFQHAWLMLCDAWRTRHWKDKFTLWFKPTGYRPADMEERFPVHKIENVYAFEKYETPATPLFKAWCWIQMAGILLLISYLFGNIAAIKQLDTSFIYWYGAFIFVAVYALTDMMDRNRSALLWQALYTGLGLAFLFWQHDWFGASRMLPAVAPIMGCWFAISLGISSWFTWKHYREDQSEPAII